MFMTLGPKRGRPWPFGNLMGSVIRAQESYVGMPEGVARAWTFKRVGEQERWKGDEALAVRGTTLPRGPL